MISNHDESSVFPSSSGSRNIAGYLVALKRIFDRVKKSRFGWNAFILIRANFFAQLLALLATPVMTRLFRPEHFGIAGLFLVYAAGFSAMASWRFEWSVPSAASEDDARDLIVLSLLLSFILAILFYILLIIPGTEKFLAAIGIGGFSFIGLLPLLSFATIAAAVLTSVFVRARAMEVTSRAKYTQSGAQLVSSLGAGFLSMGAFGLVLSNVISASVGMVTMIRGVPFRLVPKPNELPGLLSTARRYLREASTSTIVSVVNFAFGNCLPLLLTLGYSVREVGYYFVAMRLASGPAALLASGISASFWGEAALLAASDPVSLRRMYLKVISTLALFSIPIVMAGLSAPFFLSTLLGGAEWSEIGFVVIACLPYIVGTFVFSSTNHLIVYGRQEYQLFSDLIAVAGSLILLWVAVVFGWSFTLAIAGMSGVTLLAYLIRFAFHLKANNEAIRAVATV